MKKLILLPAFFALVYCTGLAQPAERQIIPFNKDWKFTKGNPSGAEQPDFNDAGWDAVQLPHDWAIAGPFDPAASGETGKLPWKGEGWYRKAFRLDAAATAGKRVYA